MKAFKLKKLNLRSWSAPASYSVCGDVAAFILPSSTIARSSPAACACDLQTGKLSYTKHNKFIMESTLREMDDVDFRVGCYTNAAMVNYVSHKPNKPNNLTVLLKDILSQIPENNIVLCYGGDIVKSSDTLLCVLEAASEFPNKHIVCKTGNGSALLDLATENTIDSGLMPGNVELYQEDAGRDSNDMFPKIERKAGGDIQDGPGLFPTGGASMTVAISPATKSRRRRKVSWWQHSSTSRNTNKPKNRKTSKSR